MSENIDLRNITKFDGSNFQLWKFQLRAVLVASGLLEITEGTTVKPEPTANTYAAWCTKNAKAMCFISSSMEYSQLEYLITCETAAEMWSKLSIIHEQKSASNKLTLMTKFHEYKMASTDSIAQHVAKIENMARHLKDVGEELSEVTIIAKILGTLPSKFNALVTAWDSVNAQDQKRDALIERLIKEERRLTDTDETANALATIKVQDSNANSRGASHKTQCNAKTLGKYKKKDFVCHYCSKKGHIARNCFKKRDDLKNNKENEKTKRKTDNDNSANLEAFLTLESNCSARILNANTSDVWLLDSGASKHMSFRREWFVEFNESSEFVSLGDDSTCEVKGRGTILIKRSVNNEWLDGKLEDVLYVPSLRKNLFSTGVCTTKGCVLELETNNVRVYRENVLIAYGIKQENNLFRMMFKVTRKTEVNSASLNSLETWHKRLGHINRRSLCEMVKKGLVNGVTLSDQDDFFCESCQFGKQHRLSFKPKERTRKTEVGELIHTDLCGPMSEESIGGAKYFLLLKDDCSSFRHVYFLRHKDDTFEKFKEFEQLIVNRFGRRIKTVRSDNGTEFRNKKMSDYMKSRGITLETSAPYIHEQNGRAEREMRTIVESARTMLTAKGLPTHLWAEAVNTAVYILNRCLSSQSCNSTPYELWYKRKPELSHIRIFGSDVYAHIPKEHRKKWDPKSKRLILVGYQGESTNYRLFNPETKQVSTARDVIINEASVKDAEYEENKISIPINNSTERNEATVEQQINIQEERHGETSDIPTDENRNINDTNRSNRYSLRRRDSVKPPQRYEACFTLFDEPKSFKEAITGENSENWKTAIQEELDAHTKNETWTIVPLPPSCKPIGCKWVFKRKKCPTNNNIRFKARLCAKGFSQRAGIDFGEIFSPVVRYDSIRVLLAIAAHEDLEIGQFDVKTAFLYGKLEEDIYMQIPDGLDADRHEEVCKLNRSLYGLKQAARCWNQRFKNVLKEFDFKVSDADPCVFYSHTDKEKVYIGLYVDDGIIMASSRRLLNKVLNSLREKFKITEGNAETFVGMEIQRNREDRTILIHQKFYIERILAYFDMNQAKPV